MSRALVSVDLSRLTCVRLAWVTLDMTGWAALLMTSLKVLWLDIIHVEDSPKTEVIHVSPRPYQCVCIEDCEFHRDAARLLAKCLVKAPKLEYLLLENVELHGTKSIWTKANTPKHLVGLKVEDVLPKELQQWASGTSRNPLQKVWDWVTHIPLIRRATRSQATVNSSMHVEMCELSLPEGVWPDI